MLSSWRIQEGRMLILKLKRQNFF